MVFWNLIRVYYFCLQVKHFTKYGMDESDDEDLSDLAAKQKVGVHVSRGW